MLGTINENGIIPAQLTTDLKPGVPSKTLIPKKVSIFYPYVLVFLNGSIMNNNSGEADRIRKYNGRVLALKEEPHIQRVWLPHEDAPGLAMSRAFGDFLLKNHGIIALPDITYRRLTSNDQFIILATDGVSYFHDILIFEACNTAET